MKIKHKEFQVLLDLFNHVPLRTPKRLDVILNFAKDILTNGSTSTSSTKGKFCYTEYNINIYLPNEEDKEETFVLDMAHLIQIEQNLPIIQCSVENSRYIMEVVLMPDKAYCCKSLLRFKSYYAELVLYCADSIKKARSYHGKCAKCKTSYYYGFQENKPEGSRIFWNKTPDVIMFTSGVASGGSLPYNRGRGCSADKGAYSIIQIP